jgi:eukaryotic-like serine/threonine-protein kinase
VIGTEGGRPARSLSLSAFQYRPTERAGQVLGDRYRIAGFLAHGVTADVHLAEDLTTGLPVMVKELTGAAAADPELRDRFVREARITMSIDHPGVVRVMAVATPEDGRPYLVMEALVGESLGELLRRQQTVPVDLALILARQAAAGLGAAHRAGVVHRDVKPDNLFLLGSTGEPFGLKVIDFGMARDVESAGKSGTTLAVGTLQYMPPEQILADPVDARTDVYALGVVLFRMLTGQLPFDTDPGIDLLAHQLFSPAPPPSWVLETLDPRLEQVVLRALRKHPENRYPDMDALLADLDGIVGIRSGSSEQPLPQVLPHWPDVYTPKTARGREFAQMLATRAGVEQREAAPTPSR